MRRFHSVARRLSGVVRFNVDPTALPGATPYFFRANLNTPGFELPELVHASS